MIPTPENIAKMQKEKREQKKKKLATQAHSKVSNDLIENTIIKNNISALKTIYYLSTKFEELGLDKYQDDQILATQIDKRELLKFTDLKLDTLIKTVKQMQRTAITFYSVDVDGGKIITGMNLLPLYEIVPNKNIVKIQMYTRIAKMIIDVKNNYTFLNIKDLMRIQNKHSLRLLPLLYRISQYGKDIAKRKQMSLEELNAFFGVNYKSWSMFEKSILIPVKEELDGISKITFTYEANFENLGIGRPSFRSIYIDLVDRNIVQGTLI